MSYLELYRMPSHLFSGSATSLDEARFAVLGVPFDATSTFRADSRFAPQAIREASMNLETYSFRTGLDVEHLRICDCGDLALLAEAQGTLDRIERVVRELKLRGKTPVLLGGEHTITLGAVRAIEGAVGVVSFDAHLDVRDTYMGASLSHATFMRRIVETIGADRVVEVGARAVCEEELRFAEKEGITFLPAHRLRTSPSDALGELRKAVTAWEQVYVTVDMDVLDPAYAPGVGNPEPEGISTTGLLDLLSEVCDKRVEGLDVTEVSPHFDMGQTALQASRIIFEVLCYVEARSGGAPRR